MERLTVGHFTSLMQAAAAVAGQPDLTAVLRTTVTVARETTGARYAALGVLGDQGTLIDFIHAGMKVESAEKIGRFPVGKGVLGTLVRDPVPIRIDDIADHPDAVGFPEHHPTMTSFLGVPVRAGDQVFGNLYLTDKVGGFTAEDEMVAETLAAVAGGAVSAARLHGRVTRLALVEDRERIARDLHDAVIQDLFAVGLSLQSLSNDLGNEEASRKLDESVERIDQAIGSLRSFIFDLRSLTSTRSDPAHAFRRMAERLAAPHGIAVQTNVDELGLVPADRLDDAILIVREAVSNAVRHAAPSTLSIVVHRETERLRVIVTDDGSGFDPATAKRGMGIENMEARAERNGGELRIESSVGVGTTVKAFLPV